MKWLWRQWRRPESVRPLVWNTLMFSIGAVVMLWCGALLVIRFASPADL